MAEYVYIQNYNNRGALGISRVVFDQIATDVTNRIQGVKIKPNSDKFFFTFHKPVHCEIRNGKVMVKIEICVGSNVNVNDVCTQIQEEVASAFTQMIEMVPFSVDIKVMGVQ